MKILLINPNRLFGSKGAYPPVLPFGLCCVASAVEHAGYDVKVLDLCFSQNCTADISDSITKLNPDIIGISVRNIDTCSANNPLFLCKEIKDDIVEPCKKSFSGPIIIGGAAVGISGAELLAYFDLEFAIRGDGEHAFVEFIRRIEQKIPLDGIKGLIIRKNAKIIEENEPLRVDDLDSLPIAKPNKYLDLQPYINAGTALQVQTKRGCVLNCTYCTYNEIEGKFYRLRSPQIVADEIEYLFKQTGIKDIEFTDSTFNIPLAHAKAVLKAVIAKNLNLNLHSMGVNPGAIDDELADLMKQAHFQDVIVNPEAGCDITLKSLGKNYTKEAISKAGEILHKRGIPIMWALLLGAPGETEQTVLESLETIAKVASIWDSVVIACGIRLYKNTPIAVTACNENPDYAKDNFLQPIFYQPETISIEQINTIVKRFAAKKPNFHIAGDHKYAPRWAVQTLIKINKMFGLAIPLFRLHIFYRMFTNTFDNYFSSEKK